MADAQKEWDRFERQSRHMMNTLFSLLRDMSTGVSLVEADRRHASARGIATRLRGLEARVGQYAAELKERHEQRAV
jgi:hypothetical protein